MRKVALKSLTGIISEPAEKRKKLVSTMTSKVNVIEVHNGAKKYGTEVVLSDVNMTVKHGSM